MSRRRSSDVGDRLAAGAIRALSWVFQRLPTGLVSAIGRGAGRLWYLFDVPHRRVAHENLRQAFGDELSAAARARIVRAVFRNVAETAVEFLTFPRMRTFEDVLEYGTLEHFDRLEDAVAEGKGVIILAAHFGNWELTAAGAAIKGMPVFAVARPLNMPRVNDAITAIRESSGLKMIQRRTGAIAALRAVRRGGVLGILADQNTRKDNVFVEFFGRPAATTPAPAFLALKTGAPVIPVYTMRVGPRSFRTIVYPRLQLVDTGNLEHDVLVNTQLCARELERMVRAHPENWFWIHRRWKTQPPPGWTPPHVPETQAVHAG